MYDGLMASRWAGGSFVEMAAWRTVSITARGAWIGAASQTLRLESGNTEHCLRGVSRDPLQSTHVHSTAFIFSFVFSLSEGLGA